MTTTTPPSSTLPGLSQGCGELALVEFKAAGAGGGKDRFPWAALIGTTTHYIEGMDGQKKSKPKWVCGGVLVNRWFVLTAAHCQGAREYKITNVRLGGFDGGDLGDVTDGFLQDFNIAQDAVFLHEHYRASSKGGERSLFNDIALIKLPTPAQLSPRIGFVCLPWDPEEYKDELKVQNFDGDLEGRRGALVGSGYTTDFDPWSGEPKQDARNQSVQCGGGVQILNKDECNMAWETLAEGQASRIPHWSQVCAGGDERGDSCKWDSGGGLFVQNERKEGTARWYLVGIHSFGSGTCKDGRPDIFIRVAEYVPWIKHAMDMLNQIN